VTCPRRPRGCWRVDCIYVGGGLFSARGTLSGKKLDLKNNKQTQKKKNPQKLRGPRLRLGGAGPKRGGISMGQGMAQGMKGNGKKKRLFNLLGNLNLRKTQLPPAVGR